MPKPSPDWVAIRTEWITNTDSLTALAARHHVARSTIRNRAKREDWPPRGAAPPPVASNSTDAAALLYADLSRALRDGIKTLRDAPASETPKDARDRAALIRAHHRALQALLDVTRTPRKPAQDTPASHDDPDHAPLDLDAARRDILRKLDRLAPP